MALVIWIIIAVSLLPATLVHVVARMTLPEPSPTAEPVSPAPRPGSRAP